MNGIPQISRPFSGKGISTAASPLLSAFNEITCRTPTTPRTQFHHGENNNNISRQYFTAAPRLSPLTPRDDDGGLRRQKRIPSIHSDEESSIDSDELRPWDERNWARSPLTPCFLTSEASYMPDVGVDGTKLGTLSAINIIIGKTVGVGVYSVPSSIFAGVGSVGMSIMMWILGALISFCGLAVYLDLGTAIPRSGGERVYLERIFRNPPMLATCMFLAYVVLLGFSAPNCIVLGEYAVYISGGTPNGWKARSIGVGVITLSCLIHARASRLGLKLINILGVVKIIIMIVVVILGFGHLVLEQGRKQSDQATETTAKRNFTNIWAGSSTQPYDYATALLKVIYCFRGYSAANQVLSDVKNPKKTLRLAAPIALGLVSIGYVLVNVAYFLIVDKEDFKTSGTVVGAHFFRNIFGETVGERILPFLIILSAFGNIAATSFAQARVNQELGRDGLLPFSSFWRRGQKTGTAGEQRVPPLAGLFIHWLVSMIVILIPQGDIYAFLVDVGGYPVSVISVAVAGGLLYLHRSSRTDWAASAAHYKARTTYVVIFIAVNAVLLILPWVPPADGKGDDSFPYYAYPMTGLTILASGGVYWFWWRWRVQRQTVQGLRTAMAVKTRHYWQAKNADEVEIPLMGFVPEEDNDHETSTDVDE
jgi:amino acid transporter